MGNNLNYLIKPSTESEYGAGLINHDLTRFLYAAASMQGWRKKQEDKFTCVENLCKKFSFFGVYDGHGGSEIAEYLQENLQFELKHFLESEEDVELALYLSFLSTDLSLKAPEIIAELNSKLEIENRGTSSEKRKKLFHHAKLLEELKTKDTSSKKSDLMEAKETGDSTQPNGTNLSKKPNTTGSAKDSCSSVTQVSSSGTTQDSSSAIATQDASSAAATQDASSAAATQDASSAAATQDASSAAATQDASSAAATQDASSAAATQDASSAAATQDASSAVATQDASSAVATQDASSAVATQDASSAAATQDASSAAATQDASSTGVTRDASSTGATQDTDSVGTQDLRVAGSAQGSCVADLTEDSNITKTDEEMTAAGPSQEFDSSTEEDTEMEDDSIDEEMEDVIGETGKNEIEQPIEYLLNQELESSDTEDEDFSYDDEETESDGSDEGIKSVSTGSTLTAEEFANIQPGDLSGSTATVVLLSDTTMYVANVGDSRCVLSRKGEAIDMTIDHKPTDAEEQERIILNGGTVRMGRVNDTIDMSRAFGDFKLKGSSLIPSEQCVTVEPTIISMPISRDDDFLVIASDGIWNAMTSQEVVDYIHMRMKQGTFDGRDICNEMFQLILSPDLENDGTGCDNMTCIIILFIRKKADLLEDVDSEGKANLQELMRTMN